MRAVRFGTGIDQPGFNLFALGPSGSGKHAAIRDFLLQKAGGEVQADDWVYVNNFETAHKPKAMRLPPGAAARFRDAMKELIDDLKSTMPALFESEDYRNRRHAIDESIEAEGESAFEDLQKKAEANSVGVVRTPMGFALAPKKNGKIVNPETFNALPESERAEIEKTIQALQKELEEVLRRLPGLEKKRRQKIRELNAALAATVVGEAMAEIEAAFPDIEQLKSYFADVQSDLIANAQIFLADRAAKDDDSPFQSAQVVGNDPRFTRYDVNVIVANGKSGEPAGSTAGAPVVFEEFPTLANLVGRIEHRSQFGALITDFTLIKPGALHRANGGYLVLDARKVLTEPFAWEALKRSIKTGRISIESAAEQLSLVSTTSLEPDAIPLSVKVVLTGEPLLYYLLVNLEPDFRDLFKVQADFDDRIERSATTTKLYARLIATIVERESLRPFRADAVARIIDQASRLAQDSERLSVQVGALTDMLCESEFLASEDKKKTVTAAHVKRALEASRDRSGRLKERSHEMIKRDIVMIDTTGETVGQINGLSVFQLGDASFGQPTRITARVRMGAGKVVDIEREVDLGGPLHSKGVLILSSFLASRYALDAPMSLWASLVFEQSYGGVDGDSASSAELYCLLSALSDAPLRQSLAVTGSVNQLGQVQAIGGVNEKIEGFFDICKNDGLNGRQGVLIPASNVNHLMLREDVVEAARRKKFYIHAVATIDQGIEILTGMPAGQRDAKGRFPAGSVNAAVEARLKEFADMRRAFGKDANGQAKEDVP
jgi:predicted ATP-dependent protease